MKPNTGEIEVAAPGRIKFYLTTHPVPFIFVGVTKIGQSGVMDVWCGDNLIAQFNPALVAAWVDAEKDNNA